MKKAPTLLGSNDYFVCTVYLEQGNKLVNHVYDFLKMKDDRLNSGSKLKELNKES